MPADHTGTIDFWRDGIVTRGVLYDIPRLRGTDVRRRRRSRCTGGSSPTPPRRRAWTPQPATRCSSAAASGPTSTPTAAEQGFLSPAGVHASCIEYLAEHEASMLVWDMQDAPIADQGIPNPRPIAVPLHVHAVVIPYMGMPILDNADFEPLAAACAELGPLGVPVRGRAPRDPPCDRFAGEPARDPRNRLLPEPASLTRR